MARGRAGEGLRALRRRSSTHRVSIESGDDHVDGGDSEGFSGSSDFDVMDCVRRDKVLDDALFGFFRAQAVKSLKRNHADFCKDLLGSNQAKKSKTNGKDVSGFTSFGWNYFLQVLKKLTSDQRAIIQKFGFDCLLLFDCCKIPPGFARWVADCVDPFCSQITVSWKSFDISKDTFHVVLGLPTWGLDVPCNSEDGRDFILSHFQL